MFNNGLGIDAAQSNNGLDGNQPSIDAPVNRGQATSVEPTSTTYYQSLTTTTTDQDEQNGNNAESRDGLAFGPGQAPDDRRDREATVRLFDEANGRESTVAARRQLGRIAGDIAGLAATAGVTGWTLVGSAIDEAVASGSAFVAPKRIREILARWDRDGVPAEYARVAPAGDAASRPVTSAVTTECGHQSQVWAGWLAGGA